GWRCTSCPRAPGPRSPGSTSPRCGTGTCRESPLTSNAPTGHHRSTSKNGREMLPPPIVRRLVLVPLLFVLALLIVAVYPVAYAVAHVLGRERRRGARLLRFALEWAVREPAAVLECGWLWLRRRTRDDRHYDVIRRYVAGLYSVAQRRLGLRLSIDGETAPGPDGADRNGADPDDSGPDDSGPDDSGPDDSDPGEGDRPLIVLSRHAGPGDALILVHHLLTDHRRRPRVVMKAALQLDPC